MNKYETPKQAITLAWANKIMKDTPCSYYDYTDATKTEWQNWLKNSDISDYTFLADNIATARYGLSQSIRKYTDKEVLTWTVHNMYEIRF